VLRLIGEVANGSTRDVSYCKVVERNCAKCKGMTSDGPHSSILFVIWVVRLLFVLFCVLFVCKCVLSPGDNSIAVNKYYYYYYYYYYYFVVAAAAAAVNYTNKITKIRFKLQNSKR
jgi:hypothetical protein